MTDKELLELAAKAAGYDISHPMNAERQEMIPPVMGFVTYLDGELQSTLWNPLDDDGQALRLVVKLELHVLSVNLENFYSYVECTASRILEKFLEDTSKSCRYAATRRAIVRAAAAIGRSL